MKIINLINFNSINHYIQEYNTVSNYKRKVDSTRSPDEINNENVTFSEAEENQIIPIEEPKEKLHSEETNIEE